MNETDYKDISVPEPFFNLLYRDCPRCYLLIAEISTQTAYLMEFNKEPYSLREIRKFEISSGKQRGGKRSEWDLRTPYGYYEIVRYRPPHTLEKKFGPGAYVLNYPNLLDEAERRTGSGIWIHGTDRIDFIDFDSEGCIRIKNDELPVLRDYLEPNKSPVLITEKLEWTALSSLIKQKESFQKRIDEWIISIQNNSVDEYLSFYSSSFYAPHLNMDYLRWMKHVKEIFPSNDSLYVSLRDSTVIRRDDRILFQAEMQLQNETISQKGTCTTVWKLQEGNWYIIQEEFISN